MCSLPPGMQASIIWCLSQARINCEAGAERGFDVKMGGDGFEGTDSLDGVVSRRIVGVSASVIFPCTIKSRRWQAVMEEVDKGCSKFCITIGTLTRTIGVLICSWLKVFAVNLSQPSGQFRLFAGLIWSTPPLASQ